MKNMILPSKLYDALKWIALLALPTLGWGYNAVSAIDWAGYMLPFGSQVMEVCCIAGTVIGVLIGVSQFNLARPVPGNETGSIGMADDED